MNFDDNELRALAARDPYDSGDDGRTSLALALGLAAALAAGGIWAALVFVTNREIGYVAWGVGLLVGVAMSRATVCRTKQLAYAAAGFAVLGLLAGKLFIFAGSAGPIAKHIASDEESLRNTMAWQLYDARALEGATLAQLDAVQAAGDTLSDALWDEMRAQASQRLAAMSAAEKHEVAVGAARQYMASMGVLGGIQAQLSPFDLLWLFLAVGTAYRMLAPAKDAPVPDGAAAV